MFPTNSVLIVNENLKKKEMTKNYVTPTEVGSYNLRNPIMLIPTLIVTKSGKNKWTLNSKTFS